LTELLPRRPGFATRLLRAAIALVLAGLVLLTLAQRFSPVSPWWLELTRYAPFQLWLGLAAGALLLSLALGRRWVAASLATLALVGTFMMDWVWHPGSTPVGPAAKVTTLRVMTYNIKAARAAQRPGGLRQLAAEIARHDPDIVLAQDAHGLPEQHAAVDDAARLFGAREQLRVGQYVIASRYPLHDCTPGRLLVADDVGTLRCTVRVDGVDIDLVTVHFESPRTGLNAARREGLDGADEWRRNYDDRLEQARLLARQLGPAVRPRIVAGDLNAPEASPVVQALLATGLRDAHSAAGRGYGFTYGQAMRVARSFLRIDHILVSAGIEVTACAVGGGEASEHRPVIAELRLPRP
jgi:endonuclease/exonuclease/phosphatase (EEP) superfamily protein YafD